MDSTEVVRWQATGKVRSLMWDGDDLVDRVDGGRRWTSDGAEHQSRQLYAYPFDRAVVSPSGRYTVTYTERGTKALLLDGQRIVRELNRSHYHAEDFDYPVALGALADGREVLVHCPEAYEVIEVEDVATGKRLTHGERTPIDVFHSRLAMSTDGKHLLSAGWLWSPFGIARVYDLERALTEPAVLDDEGLLPPGSWADAEIDAACWLDGDRLAVATGEAEADEGDLGVLGPEQLGVWSISERKWLHRHRLEVPMGTLIGHGDRVIALCEYPRLIDVATGAVLAEWPEVVVSSRVGSYGVTHVPTPVAALHPDGSRLAVAQPDGIAIIALPRSASCPSPKEASSR
ncbi:hypothetical protein [Streptomyces sp. RK62]|uniref:hypothetical protein n=1 Tax=Streptomyces sp. RK62 TaxID=2824893 RepID=UPI001B36DAE0|nr:hypothetical protein [Streptomyces sp. RK62]MBQ0997926.1 hypothetical protein [Streptomyces sp. RK62]